MESPTAEEIKEKYKNCKIVLSAYLEVPFDITEYDFNSIYKDGLNDIYIVHKKDKRYVRSLFDHERGFSKISSYNN